MIGLTPNTVQSEFRTIKNNDLLKNEVLLTVRNVIQSTPIRSSSKERENPNDSMKLIEKISPIKKNEARTTIDSSKDFEEMKRTIEDSWKRKEEEYKSTIKKLTDENQYLKGKINEFTNKDLEEKMKFKDCSPEENINSNDLKKINEKITLLRTDYQNVDYL